jgi:hypothetical protein
LEATLVILLFITTFVVTILMLLILFGPVPPRHMTFTTSTGFEYTQHLKLCASRLTLNPQS